MSKNLETKCFCFPKQIGSSHPGVSGFACSRVIGAFRLGPFLNTPKIFKPSKYMKEQQQKNKNNKGHEADVF